MCGDISCGSSSMANNGSRIQFTWADPGTHLSLVIVMMVR